MTTNPMHPFTLEVFASERSAGMFEWTIRKHGKLAQRADKLHRSEADAHRDGLKAIERQFTDSQGQNRAG